MILLGLTNKQIFQYALLPQITPRIRNFISDGFKNLAYFMVLVYRAVNLLPAGHAYLQPDMSGKYTIRDVLIEASKNLNFSIKYIDQIIVFFALIVGMVLLSIQFALLFVAFLINPATAQTAAGEGGGQPQNYGDFFITSAPEEDLALRLLDQVFGVPGMFNSKDIAEGSNSFHVALHQLLQFYSIGLLVIAVIIVIYFIFAILAETAQTGTPFGKRYNHAWAPIRLVAAIGLLIPIGTGLNSGQWITLYAAKFGSGFATNGWNKFNETIREGYIPPEELVATPHIPDLKDISAFMMLAHACKEGYRLLDPDVGENIDAYIINGESSGPPVELSGTLYSTAVEEHASSGNIRIRIGEQNDAYSKEIQKVYPHCGEITLSIPSNPFRTTDTPDQDTTLSGGAFLNARYYVMIKQMWDAEGTYAQMKTKAEDMIKRRLDHDNSASDPDPKLKADIIKEAKEFVEEGLKQSLDEFVKEIKQDKGYLKYGWGGAGIWYNDIADVNGRITTAAMNKPQITTYAFPMEYTCEKNQQQNNNVSPEECYNTRLAQGKDAQYVSLVTKDLGAALSDVFNYWHKDPGNLTGNAFIDTINVIMGTQGLFDLCSAENVDIHPLAQLSSVGKGLVDAAIRNLGFGLGTGAAGILVPYFGPALQSASSFLITVASIGILIGFILFYVVPFLPFLYFLFAVGGWVKGLFEAMVGVPLWALAHIRIDGQGLPGDAAINGYFLVFEIFIRPILIVFGLLASILIFGAMVKVLNEIFSLVTSNLSGFNGSGSTQCGTGVGGSGDVAPTGSIDYLRGPVDEFFFTILYAIIVYMIGMSSFKLIDLIPNNILRWMGAGVSTFNDQAGEPAEGLLTKIAVGGSLAGGQLQAAGSAFGSAVGSGVQGISNRLNSQ